MGLSLILFGLFSGTLVAVLIGMLGARRNIGFGWAFLLSLLFTPLVGLILVLLSDRKESGEVEYGCLGQTLGCFGMAILILIAFAAVAVVLALLTGSI